LKQVHNKSFKVMDAGLSALLLDWRGRCPYNQDTDYVFASAEMEGRNRWDTRTAKSLWTRTLRDSCQLNGQHSEDFSDDCSHAFPRIGGDRFNWLKVKDGRVAQVVAMPF
jgi:hypothetical protein